MKIFHISIKLLSAISIDIKAVNKQFIMFVFLEHDDCFAKKLNDRVTCEILISLKQKLFQSQQKV